MLVLSAGCATGKLELARQSFYSGRLDYATTVLDKPSEISRRDRLLYYMEKGAILHHLDAYSESIRVLRAAADLIDRQEIISAGRQTGSLVTSEWLTNYKGEYAERLWVHTYLMMNYLLASDPEDALVEAKQALEVYDAHPEALESTYFTRALIAHCFEAVGETNGAYIEYKKLAEMLGDPAPVADKLVMLARRLGFFDEVEKYARHLPAEVRRQMDAGIGPELIFFVSQGRSPVKIPQNIVVPPSIRFSFATYRERTRMYHDPVIYSAGGEISGRRVRTDLAQALSESLKERAAQIIAKETARVAVKEAISQNIEDAFLEALIRGAFFVMEEPDTRAWETLPAYWTMIRVPLSPGTEEVPAFTVKNAGRTFNVPEFRLIRQYTYFSLRNGEPDMRPNVLGDTGIIEDPS